MRDRGAVADPATRRGPNQERLAAITGAPSRVLSITDPTAPQHGAKVSFESTDSTQALAAAAAPFAAGSFTLPVERTFSLDHIGAAHELSAQGHVTGRLVVTIG